MCVHVCFTLFESDYMRRVKTEFDWCGLEAQAAVCISVKCSKSGFNPQSRVGVGSLQSKALDLQGHDLMLSPDQINVLVRVIFSHFFA